MESCWGVFLAEIEELGFCNALYGFASGENEGSDFPEVTYFSNYSNEWEEVYERLGGHKNDVGVAHCLASVEDMRWYTSETMAMLTPEQRAVEVAAWEWGVINGITFPLRAGPGGSLRGGIGLASRLDDEAFDAMMSEQQDYLRLISQLFHAFVLSRPLAKNISRLTDKEKEALTLAGRGLKNKQISHQLGITEKAVEARLQGAMTKLESTSRTQAVAEAMRLQILKI